MLGLFNKLIGYAKGNTAMLTRPRNNDVCCRDQGNVQTFGVFTTERLKLSELSRRESATKVSLASFGGFHDSVVKSLKITDHSDLEWLRLQFGNLVLCFNELLASLNKGLLGCREPFCFCSITFVFNCSEACVDPPSEQPRYASCYWEQYCHHG